MAKSNASPLLNTAALKPDGISDEAWAEIVSAWQNGLSDREAAFRACSVSGKNIKESDIKRWCKEDSAIAYIRDFSQSKILTMAKLTILEKISEGDVATAKWYLERKAADEFSTKAQVKFEGDAIELSIEDKERKMQEFMERFGEKDDGKK